MARGAKKKVVEKEELPPIKHEETVAEKADSLENLLRKIQEMPTAWYSPVFKTLVDTAKQKKVFQDGRITEFVRGIEHHGEVFTSALNQ